MSKIINLSFVSLVIICSCELLAQILNCKLRFNLVSTLWFRNMVCIAHTHTISIVLLTLYIYIARFGRCGFWTIHYYTLYCFPVVDVSYVVNVEIKRPGRIITICCITSCWMIYKVFTFTIGSSEQCDIYRTVVISYWTPAWINTTIKWLVVVSGDIYCWIWI